MVDRERSLRRSAGSNTDSQQQQHLSEYQDRTVNTMRRLEEFQIKSIKYHQREITFLTNNVDPYHHIIEARFSVLERAFLAKVRQRKREEIAGVNLQCSSDAKRHFLCYFFGRTDYYMNMKRKELEQQQKAIAPSPKGKPVEKALSDNDKDDGAESNKRKRKRSRKGKDKEKDKDKEPDVVRVEDNVMYLGADPCVVTLDNPSYCSQWPSDDSFIECILDLAENLPEALDEMMMFQNKVDSKKSAVVEELKKEKKVSAMLIIHLYLIMFVFPFLMMGYDV